VKRNLVAPTAASRKAGPMKDRRELSRQQRRQKDLREILEARGERS